MEQSTPLAKILSIDISPDISTFDEPICFKVEYEIFKDLSHWVMHSVFYYAPYFKDGKICLQGQGTIDDNRGRKGIYVQQLQTKVGHCADEGLSCPFDIELPAHEAIGVHELIFNSLYRDQLFTEYRWMVVNEEIAPKKENTYSIPAQVTSELDEKIIIFDKSLDQLGEEILKLYPYTKPLRTITYGEDIDESVIGPFYVECDNCTKQLSVVRFKCLECEDYDLCKNCERTGMHKEHAMIELRESHMERCELENAEAKCRCLIHNLKMIVSGFISIVKNYLTDSNEQVLLNIQEKIEHSLHSLIITKDNSMVYNKQEGKSIVSTVEEIQHIIMNNFKSDRTKNQVFIHFKSINDLFFKNLKHLLNYIVNVISSSKPDALQLLVGINKLMELEREKEAEENFTIIGALRHFLLITETARRKRIRRTVKFKSSRVYSIKWKSQEEMVIPPNTYATNMMELEIKKLMRQQFYSKLEKNILPSYKDPRKDIIDIYDLNVTDSYAFIREWPKLMELYEMKKCLASEIFPMLIPSTVPMSMQKSWLNLLSLSNNDEYEYSYKYYKSPLTVWITKWDCQFIPYEFMFQIIHGLHIETNHGDHFKMEQEGGMSIPKYAFNIYLDLCKTCRNKKLYGFNKIKNELNDAISLAGDLMRQPWYSDDVRRNPFWHKNYSKEMYASLSDLWARLEKNLFEVFNNGLELRNFEEMTKILYTLYYIKPILSRRLKMQNKVLMIINKYLEAFFGAFMNRVRTIECVNKDQEFLVKYARLWLLFLRGTMILDHVFGKFEEDLQGTNRASYSKLMYYKKTKIVGGGEEERDLTTYPCLAMNAWRETFFNGLNNRLVSVVVSLIEKERNGEKFATSTIPIELEYLDHYSLLIGVDKLDLDQRLHQLSPTMMDHYNVMKYFHTFIYSFVQRPLALAVDNLLKLPSPTEVEVQQIIDSITAWKPDKNETNNTSSIINTRKKSDRNSLYSWRKRMKKKLGQITDSLGLIENYYKELNQTKQLKKMVEQLHQELYTLCINYPNECELQENQELKRRIDEQISALKFPDPDEDLNVKLYTKKLYDKFIRLVDQLDKDKEFYEKHRIDSIKNRFSFFI